MPATEVARRAGHSVTVLLKIYAHCIDGQADAANKRITDALAATTPVRTKATMARHPDGLRRARLLPVPQRWPCCAAHGGSALAGACRDGRHVQDGDRQLNELRPSLTWMSDIRRMASA